MHRALLLLSIILFCHTITFNIYDAYAENYGKCVATILDSAEKFFIALKENKFETAWELLSKTSQKTIINDVYKASKEVVKNIKKEDIKENFEKKGVVFKNYWNSFLNTFNPDMILEESQWEMRTIKKNKAEIMLTYKKLDTHTILQMYKENGVWKIGLVETFWTRKRMKFLDFIL